jgi:dethiobiotin synthetase
LVQRHVSVRPRKPVESGCRKIEGRLLPLDAETLRQASNTPEPLHLICPYPLEPALSPERAARQSDLPLTLAMLEEACLKGLSNRDFLLVEGAGGFYSPLSSDGLNKDLAMAVQLPVLLVVIDRLGGINHALLTAEAILRCGLELEAVVLNRYGDTHEDGMDNKEDLERLLDRPVTAMPDVHQDSTVPWQALLPAVTGLIRSILNK